MTRPPFWIAAALSAGIVFARAAHGLPPLQFLFVSLLFLILAVRAKLGPRLFWIFSCAAVFFLGPALISPYRANAHLDLDDGPLTIVGTVETFPVTVAVPSEPRRLRYILKAERVQSGSLDFPCHIKLQVHSDPTPQKLYKGDRLELTGQFQRPQGPRNPGGFDARKTLEAQGLDGFFYVKNAGDAVILSSAGARASRILQNIRDGIVSKIDRHLTFPENAVLKAVLLGDQWEIGPDLRDAFGKSGTSHLLAISGGNIAVIAAIILSVLSIFRCPRRTAYALTLILLWIYCLLTVGAPSIVRATIMMTIALAGVIFKREPEPVTSLSWAAIVILVAAPLQIFDLGFQLSFITVLWMVTLLPADGEPVSINKQSKTAYIFWAIRQSVFLSAFAWLATVPHSAGIFHMVTPIAVVANLFVVPYFGLVMASGLCFLFLGALSPVLAELFGFSAQFFTHFFIRLSDMFAAIPCGSFHVGPPSAWQVCAYYALYLMWVLRHSLKIKTGVWAVCLLFFIDASLLRAFVRQGPNPLKITFLDVGHGDAAVVQFPSGKVLLIDAGDGSRERAGSDKGRRVVAPFLWSRGITRLDAVVITHPHQDHYGGLPYLMKEFSIGRVFDNGDANAGAYNAMFRNEKITRVGLKDGDLLLCDPIVRTWVRHPPAALLADPAYADNDRSVVLQIIYGKYSVLFMGDAEEKAQEVLCGKGARLKCFLLKVPHHGSDEKSSADELLRILRPQIAVISEAEKNKFNLPRPQTIRLLEDCGAQIFQTGIVGAVQFETDGKNYRLKTMADP